MRRWLAALLLVLLPVQFCWAAVAAYCMHASGVVSSHVGHHDHAAHAHGSAAHAEQSAATSDPSGPATLQLDCGHCHGHFAAVIALAPAAQAPTAAATPPRPGIRPRAEHLPAPPERPQWPRLA